MNPTSKEIIKTLGASATGGGVGAGVYGVIGGVGLTAVGTGVGITLGPFIAIGAGVGAAEYGLFWLGKQVGKKRTLPERNTTPTESA
jgi:hypothetical protein